MRIVMLAMLAVLTGRPVDSTYVTLGDNRSHPLATCRLSPRPSDCLQPANTNYKTNGIGFNITACGWPAVKRQEIADEQITLLHQVRTLYQMGDEYERVSFGRLTDGALQPAEPAGYLEPWPQPDLLLLSEGVWGPLFAPSSQLAQHQYSATPPPGSAKPMEQLQRLFSRANSSFDGPIIWLSHDGVKTHHYQAMPPSLPGWLREQQPSSRILVVDRREHLRQARDLHIPYMHGYEGDVGNADAKLLLEMMLSLFPPDSS